MDKALVKLLEVCSILVYWKKVAGFTLRDLRSFLSELLHLLPCLSRCNKIRLPGVSWCVSLSHTYVLMQTLLFLRMPSTHICLENSCSFFF